MKSTATAEKLLTLKKTGEGEWVRRGERNV
jgi:hypothetical protein